MFFMSVFLKTCMLYVFMCSMSFMSLVGCLQESTKNNKTEDRQLMRSKSKRMEKSTLLCGYEIYAK